MVTDSAKHSPVLNFTIGILSLQYMIIGSNINGSINGLERGMQEGPTYSMTSALTSPLALGSPQVTTVTAVDTRIS